MRRVGRERLEAERSGIGDAGADRLDFCLGERGVPAREVAVVREDGLGRSRERGIVAASICVVRQKASEQRRRVDGVVGRPVLLAHAQRVVCDDASARNVGGVAVLLRQESRSARDAPESRAE